MKKQIIAVGAASLLAFSLIGCSSSNGDSAKKGGKEVVEVAYPDWWTPWMSKMEKDYEAAHKNVDIKLVKLTANNGDIYSKEAMMLKSPSTAPDVVVEDTFMINSDSAADYIAPMDNYVSNWSEWNDFVPTTKESVTAVDGKIYGVPFSTDVQGLWYDKKLFKKAGLPVPFKPKSWQDVLDAAKVLKEKTNVQTPLFSYVAKSAGENTTMRTFEVLYSGTGAKLYDTDKKKWVVNEKAMTDTLGFVNTLMSKKLGPTLSMANNSQIDTIMATDYMPKDQVGMAMDSNFLVANWRKGGAKPWPNALDTWAFTAFPTENGQAPGYTSMSGGWALAIAKNSDQKDAAWDFIKMVGDKEHLMTYTKMTGDMTPRSDIAKSNDYLDQDLSIYRESANILNYTHFRPAVGKYPSVSTIIQEAVESVAVGKSSPKQAVKEYENGLDRVVGKDNVIIK